jgi:hypothetical protein
VGPERYRFAHALVQDALYQSTATSRRLRLHRRAAQVIEALASDRNEDVVAVAHHLAEVAAGDPAMVDRAVTQLRRAGDRAMERVAPDEAGQHYEAALALLHNPPTDWELECDILLALGDAHTQAGTLNAARPAYARAADLARDHGDGTRLAAAALGYAGPPRSVLDNTGVVDILGDALLHLSEHEVATRAVLLALVARSMPDGSEEKHATAEEAVRLARQSGDALLFAGR